VLQRDGLKFEVDIYRGDLEGLMVAEIEFPSEEEANAFDPPGWLGDEVTGDHRYLNETLATTGAPAGRFRSH
jgi:CYTH domain-containing protein